MKTYLFPMLAMLLCVFSGCSRRTNTKPLAGTSGLATFTVPADDGETLLTGVKRPATGDTIVPPAAYTDIKGDSCVITCTRADRGITAYTTGGRKIGDFELFSPWSGFCLGVRYLNKTYYFPATDEIITTRHSLHELELLFLRTGNGWEVRTCQGELKSTFEADSLWIIRHAKIPTRMLIGTTDSLTAGCRLHTADGVLYQKLSSRQWLSLREKFRNRRTEAGTVTTADIDEFDKI